MSPNKHRGEITADFDGKPHTLCLTLGALAELEAAFGDEDMLALALRFQSGRIAARDALRIIGAGLRGGGHALSDDDVAQLRTDDGAAGYVRIVAALLGATFGAAPAGAAPASQPVPLTGADPRPADPPDPFPGPR
jgi:hypothetical protein